MSKYKELKRQLNEEKSRGEAPKWLHHTGYQVLRSKGYLDEGETVLERNTKIAETLATHLPEGIQEEAKGNFFRLMWEGIYSHSTPALSNIGKPYKGMPIACSGGWVEDSIKGFYDTASEVAMLSKNGFGTSAYLGDIRPRGSKISSGGTADGIVPVADTLFDVTDKVSQGGNRRGSIAVYFDIDHPDSGEVFRYVENNLDGKNIGVNITNDWIERFQQGNPEANSQFQDLMYLRMLGKGYVHFVDRANSARHEVFKKRGLEIKGSNLCAEIELPSNEEYTFTCCLGSINLLHYDSLSDEDIKWSLLMLDCVNSEFIKQCPEELSKAKRMAEEFRPLGLGVMGLHSYFQEKGIVFDSIEAQFKNVEIFKRLATVGKEVNKWMATLLGEPSGLEGYGIRNVTQMAVAPTLSTSAIMGVSEGIAPTIANVYIFESAAGDIRRANPWTAKLLKSKGMWTKEILESIIENEGSLSHLEGLTEKEKAVGKTAFEISQAAILRMADQRATYIDQGQSVNLFLNGLAEEREIGDLHRYAVFDLKNIKSLYYVRSMPKAGSKIRHTQETACESCAG